MKTGKRLIAMTLAAIMFLLGLPVSVLAGEPETKSWAWNEETGRLDVDYEGFLSQHDLVYNNLPLDGEIEGMPVANGRTGANVWQDNGIRMQIHSVDNAPNSAFSAAQVRLSTAPALTDEGFNQRLHLYDGYISIAQNNGFTAEVFGIPGTETLGLHVKDTRPDVRMIAFDIELWKTPENLIRDGGTTEVEAWQTVDYFEEDGVVGFTKGISEEEPFGYAFAAAVDGAEATILQLDDTTARVYITAPEDGEYTIWMSSASRYYLEQGNETGAYETTAADTFASAKKELDSARAMGYESAMDAFQNWWHAYWESSFISYENSSEAESDYLENIYYLAQYHFGGASDAVFPLQWMRGVYTAMKDEDIHWNIGYWHFNQRAVYNAQLASNHVDGFLRHVDFYDRVKDVMTEYTRQRFGYEGAMKTTETMRWDGYPDAWPLNENPEYQYWNSFDNDYVGWIYSTGPEVAENMYYAYKYTMDESLLEKYYDYMKRTVEFIVQWARWDEETGQYHLDDSNSLENWWRVNNATTDNAGARSLLPKYLEAAEILGKTEEDAELVEKAADVLEKLEPITIVKGEDRYAPYDIYDKTVGNCNLQNPELEVVYPHNLVGLDHPDLQTAINTYNARSFDLQIWGACGVQAARLGLGDEAQRYLGGMINRNQKRITGWTDDGNGKMESMGYHVNTINEMYLQSYDDLIRVFPAVPTDEEFRAAFTLLASGGFLVSSEYDQQQVQYIGLLSQYGGKATVKIPWADADTVLLNGKETAVSDGRITFDTEQDGKYLILPVSAKDVQIETTALTGMPNEGVKKAFGKTLGIAGTEEASEPTEVVYSFDDGMDDGFFTDSANGNDAAINGSVTAEAHDNGSAAAFSSGGYLQIPHSATFNPTDDFVCTFEIKCAPGDYCLFDKSAPLGQSNTSGFYMDTYGGNLRVIAGPMLLSCPASLIADGNWHSVEVVFSTTLEKLEVSVDGQVQATTEITSPMPTVAAPGRIGLSRLSAQPFTGSLDNFSITPLDLPEPVDEAPEAVDDAYAVDYNQRLMIRFPGVLENDLDEKPEQLTAALSSQPAHGTLTFLGDGGFVYTPEQDYTGADSFTYVSYDAAGQYSLPATVRLYVGMSALPVDDVYTAYYGEELHGNVTDNDAGATGGALAEGSKVVFVPDGEQETCPVALNEDGSFTYVPGQLPQEPGYYPDEQISFRYRIESETDGETVASEPARVTIRVTRHAEEPGVLYDFDQPFEGSVVTDASGNKNHGEIVGGVTRTEEGTCLLDGTGYMKLPHTATTDLCDDFEIFMRVKTDANRNQVFFDKSNRPGDQTTGGFYMDTYGGNIRIFFDALGTTPLTIPAPFTTDAFTDVRITYSTRQGELRVYLNGELKGSTPVDEALPYVPSYGVIGKKLSADSFYFAGEIDEFRIGPLEEETPSSVSYVIRAEQTEGGTINPASKVVSRGGKATFSIKPDEGYAIADVLVDGKSVGAVESYTFEKVSAKHTISAEFTKSGETGKPVAGFDDVRTTDWFAQAVQYVVDEGLMNGTSDTTFSPKNATTRGMIVTILYRLAGSPEVESDGATWWSDARVWAMDEGVSDGTNMDKAITREQLATMLYRYAGSEEVEGDLSTFTDGASVSDWAVDALIWATTNEIVTGKTGGVIDPQAGATRAETATMLMRFCELNR